jgi:hypothetical protein
MNLTDMRSRIQAWRVREGLAVDPPRAADPDSEECQPGCQDRRP